MKNKQKEQIKRKLILSFLLLFYLDPIKIYYLKSFQQKRSKDSFRSKLKKFKNLLFCLENFSIKILKTERINTISYISGLEDLLNV